MSSVARALGAAALTVLLTVPPAGAAVPSSTVVAVQGSAGPVLVGYGQPVVALGQVSVPGAVPDDYAVSGRT